MAEIKFVDVNGINTRYIEAGSGDPLLLVHGGQFGSTFNAEDWDTVIEPLAKDFRVLSIDKIGQGFTDNPKTDAEYVIGSTAKHAYEFLQTLDIDSAHMAGHSRGGYTITRIALEHPEAVKTLTNVSSATLMGMDPPQYMEWAQTGATKEPRDRIRYMAEVNSYSGDHIDEHFLDVGVEIEASARSQEASGKMRDGLYGQFKKDMDVQTKDARDRIQAGELKTPMLVIWGFNDPSAVFDPITILALKLLLPSIERSEAHLLNHAGHYCYREQRDSFVDTVTRFIKAN